MLRSLRLVLPVALGALAVFAGTARADNPLLVGDVGLNDAYRISLLDASGAPVTHLDPGTYTLVVHDHSANHNFHLFGTGVDASTDVDFVGDQTFTVTVTDGVYTFECDPHNTVMHGSFTVGTAPAPAPTPQPAPAPAPKPKPKPEALSVTVGPGVLIGVRGVAALAPGKAVVTVGDRSRTDGVRLVGPGVSRATGIAFRGTVRWTVTLKAGTYVVRSERHPTLRRRFVVR